MPYRCTMLTIAYEDMHERLTPEARSLFRDMVNVHLSSTGDRIFIDASTMGGRALIFTGVGAQRELEHVDGGALDDLVGYGLLHLGYSSRGTPNYRVAGEGVQFHKWLMSREGEAVSQTEEEVRRLLDSDAFAREHPQSAHHLREAFALMWGSDHSDQVTSEIGDHLRKALMDLTTDIVGADAPGEQEKPIDRLTRWMTGREGLSEREGLVLRQLVELAEAVLRLDHRLNHVRDEADKGRQPPMWDETHRAAFTTAFTCYELARAARSG